MTWLVDVLGKVPAVREVVRVAAASLVAALLVGLGVPQECADQVGGLVRLLGL